MDVSIQPVLCTQCGATIKMSYCASFITCPYCGTSFSVKFDDSTSNTISKDEPIEVDITEIESGVVELSGPLVIPAIYQDAPNSDFQKLSDQIEALVYLIQNISSILNKEYEAVISLPGSKTGCGIGRVGVRAWSSDKINWHSKQCFDTTDAMKKESQRTFSYIKKIMRILEKYDFMVNEFWVDSKSGERIQEASKSLIDIIAFRKKYCKTYCESCFLEGTINVSPIADYTANEQISRLRNSEAVINIANGIIECLHQEEEAATRCSREGEVLVNISVEKEKVAFHASFCTDNEGGTGYTNHKFFVFHSMGMEDIYDYSLMEALVINLIDQTVGSGRNASHDWMVRNVYCNPEMNIHVTLQFKKAIKKIYKDW